MSSASTQSTDVAVEDGPWPALWALVVGFFMVLVDSTIVSIATPAIMTAFGAEVDEALWVTSAYLLAYAVPLLITGRLGDRFGPRNVYLFGLALFTAASLWCALTTSVEALIVARVAQGLGASLMTPQAMAVITRTFPAQTRGKAMSLWGATAGVAILVGPLLGGLLVDGPGWEAIFLINVPIGLVGFVLAAKHVPRLPTHSHSFDWLGTALSASGLFLVVFAIQQGEHYEWGQVWWVLSVPVLLGLGFGILGVFVLWQHRVQTEPLVPLFLFRDRNFSLSNVAVAAVSFTVTAMAFPFMLYAQSVRGWSPTRSALLLVPMAVLAMALAPVAGKLVDRLHPRVTTTFGMVTCGLALLILSALVTPQRPWWMLLVPMALLGVANSFMWAPLAVTATRNLPLMSAGAGSGVYNATRQVGAVLGSAMIAVLMQARLTASAAAAGSDVRSTAGAPLPRQVAAAFSSAMSDALLLPAAVILVGAVATLAFTRVR